MFGNHSMFENPKIIFEKQALEILKPEFSKLANRDVVIWGTGGYGKLKLKLFSDFGLKYCVKAFCNTYHDDSKTVFIEGVPELSPKTVTKQFPNALYIIASDYAKEIKTYIEESEFSSIEVYTSPIQYLCLEKQLVYYYIFTLEQVQNSIAFNYTWFDIYLKSNNDGSLDKNLKKTLELLSDEESKTILTNRVKTLLTGDYTFLDSNHVTEDEYYSSSIFSLTDKEVYFDCGAFDGDSLLAFHNFTKGKYKSVICFEPDKKNYLKILSLVNELKQENVIAKNEAIGSESKQVWFSSSGTEASKVSNDGCGESINQIKLDEYFDYLPTFIKMDIEGYEIGALQGAKRIITTLKPKLAICIYHKPFDLFDIPLFLHSLVPEYKFKVRQHEKGFYGTVLYAYAE